MVQIFMNLHDTWSLVHRTDCKPFCSSLSVMSQQIAMRPHRPRLQWPQSLSFVEALRSVWRSSGFWRRCEFNGATWTTKIRSPQPLNEDPSHGFPQIQNDTEDFSIFSCILVNFDPFHQSFHYIINQLMVNQCESYP